MVVVVVVVSDVLTTFAIWFPLNRSACDGTPWLKTDSFVGESLSLTAHMHC